MLNTTSQKSTLAAPIVEDIYSVYDTWDRGKYVPDTHCHASEDIKMN
jgi:hypothetical protein